MLGGVGGGESERGGREREVGRDGGEGREKEGGGRVLINQKDMT